jgi:hypothetical protein
MTLLTIIAMLVAVAAFGLGWICGYKKSCDAHGWNLPQFDWKRESEVRITP